jgi:hypothetical protein
MRRLHIVIPEDRKDRDPLLLEKAIRLSQRRLKVYRFSVVVDVIPEHDETPEGPLLKLVHELVRQLVLRSSPVARVPNHHKGLGGMHGPACLRRVKGLA